MKQQTGNEDQRYVNLEDHLAARAWFERCARRKANKLTRQDRIENVRKLRKMIEALDLRRK